MSSVQVVRVLIECDDCVCIDCGLWCLLGNAACAAQSCPAAVCPTCRTVSVSEVTLMLMSVVHLFVMWFLVGRKC